MSNMHENARDTRLGIARARGGTWYISAQGKTVRFRRVEDRFSAKYQVQEDGCWRWTDALRPDGYGTLMLGTDLGTMLAHRVSYLLQVGPIPAGHELDHLCRNRACVNPKHLEPVLHRENGVRGQVFRDYKRKTHCKRGHSVAEHGHLRADGYYACNTCQTDNQRERRAKAKLR